MKNVDFTLYVLFLLFTIGHKHNQLLTTKILHFFLEIEHTTLCVVLGQPMINTDELSLFEAMVCFKKYVAVFLTYKFKIIV